MRLNDSLNLYFKPNWDKINYQKINDSIIYTIVHLKPEGNKSGAKTIVNLHNYEKFILFKNDTVAYIGTFTYAEGKEFSGNFLKNGNLTLNNLLNGYSSFYNYVNGKASNFTTSEKRSLLKKSKIDQAHYPVTRTYTKN